MQTLCELRCNIVILKLGTVKFFISSNHIVWLIMHIILKSISM